MSDKLLDLQYFEAIIVSVEDKSVGWGLIVREWIWEMGNTWEKEGLGW